MRRAVAWTFVLVAWSWAGPVAAAEACAPVVARIVSVSGRVDLVRPRAPAPSAVTLNATLCVGDSLRVQKYASAAIRLTNETTIRLDQGTTLTLAPPEANRASLLQQWSGGIHVMTRTPRPFNVKTPFVNANIDGTEFTVRVMERSATVSVVEGVVVAANEAGNQRLVSGESATASPGVAPRRDLTLRPRDAVVWALHFPTILDPSADAFAASGTQADGGRLRVVELYRAGAFAEALTAMDEIPEGAWAQPLRTLRAGMLLLVGRLDEAKPLVELVVQTDPGDGNGMALLAIIALIENQSDSEGADRALALSRQAVARDPRSTAALMARSYAEQARFDLQAALASVEAAIRLEPRNALAHARRAELEMAIGNLDGALSAAQAAAAIRPEISRTQSVLGFASLLRIDTAAARGSFERAIAMDSTDPMPRLGLGLVMIREGDLSGGRAEIETAVILDPRNALVRSYVGKAYYEEQRDTLAGEQFALAKEHDPRDPTPHFYDAIRLFAGNRPVEALRELDRSIVLNDNRAVVRSILLLQDDRAARATSLATLYGELGFERLAIIESVKALADHAGNEAAHRQLAAGYAHLPRHDIARVSEALQAEIRQPLSLTPIDPQLSNDNLGILRGSGPSRLGTSEFNQLFVRDGTRLQVDAIGGSRSTRGDQIMLSAISGSLGYGLSHLHYETDGFRTNSRAEKNSLDGFVHAQVSPSASLQIHLKRTDFSLGQTFLPFDETLAFPVTIKERSNVARLSGHFVPSPASDWVVSAAREQRVRAVEYAPDGSLVTQTDARSHSLALQHLGRFGAVQLVTGFESLNERDTFPIETGDIVSNSRSLYSYAHWRAWPDRLVIQLGASLERLDIRNSSFEYRVERDRLKPKLGVLWTPTSDTAVRAAAFSSVKRPLVASQTLEPTQVAGFNQFFSGFDTFYGDPDGTVSRRAGLAVDQRIGRNTFAGAEVAARRLDVPSFIAAQDFRWRERTAHLYLYDMRAAAEARWLGSGWSLSKSIEYEYEKIERPQILTGAEAIVQVATHRVPLGLRLFRGDLSWRFGATYVRQRGKFSADVGYDTFAKSTSGWLADVGMEYRLPHRSGTVVLGVRNAVDKSLDLFQVDPLTPRDAIGRLGYARIRLAF